MTLYINGKQIQTFGANKLVQGENRAEAVTFKLNMADASSLAFFLIWQNERGEGNSSVPLETVRNGDDISLTWYPSRESSSVSGKLAIQLYAVESDGENDVRKWMTYPTFLVVSSSLVVTEASPIDPSALDVYLARFEALYQKTLKDASERIDEEAEAKIEDIANAKADALSAVSDKAEEEKLALGNMAEGLTDGIEEAKEAGIGAVNDAAVGKVEEINQAKTSAISDLDTKAETLKSNLDTYANTKKGDLDVYTNTKKTEINNATSGVVSQVTAEGTRQKGIVQSAATEGINAVNNTRDGAVATVQATGSEQIAAVESAGSSEVARVQGVYQSDLSSVEEKLAQANKTITNLEYENRITKAVLAKKIAEETEATGTVIPFPSTGEDGYPLAEWGELKRLKSDSVVWNQYIHDANFEDESKWYRRYGNFVFLGNGKLRVMGAGNNKSPFIRPISEYMNIKSSQTGHIFYAYVEADVFESLTKIDLGINSGDSSNQGFASMTTSIGKNVLDSCFKFNKTLNVDGFNPYIQFYTNNTYDESVKLAEVSKPILSDMTTLFGITEVSAVTEEMKTFVRQYAEAHPEYDAGSLLSSRNVQVKSVGVNLLDLENQYIGNYYTQPSGNGYALTSNSEYNAYRVPVKANTEYTMSSRDGGNLSAEGGIIRFEDSSFAKVEGSTAGYARPTVTFTTPNTCAFIVFSLTKGNSNPRQLEEGSEATDYAPHMESSLDLSFLNGVPNIGIKDTVIDFEQRTVEWKWGKVDLGTLSWTPIGKTVSSTGLTGLMKPPSNNFEVANMLSRYRADSAENTYAEVTPDTISYGVSGTNGILRVYDSKNSTVPDDSNNWLSGVWLAYELAEPITKTFEELGIVIPSSWDGGKPWIRVEAGGKFTVVSSGAEAEATVSFVTDLRRA